MLVFPSPPWHERGFEFGRRHRDFSDRVLDLLSPHLVRAVRLVELRRRLRNALAALDGGDDDRGIVLLDSHGRVDDATARARTLLGKFFGSAGASLPDPVAGWLGHSREPLVCARGASRIVVERVGQSLLVREEPAEAAKVAGLTPREQQVLGWVTEGKTNAEIAGILVTAPGTVRKHLEHIYAKLGVHARTAAASYARTRLAAAV
jgi:DNA-binding CsgD family transcriptional regulator